MTHPVCPSVAPKPSRMVGIATLVIEPFITITPTASATTSSNDRTGSSPAARVFSPPSTEAYSLTTTSGVGERVYGRGSGRVWEPVPSLFDVGQGDGHFSLVMVAFRAEYTIATIKLLTNGRERFSARGRTQSG